MLSAGEVKGINSKPVLIENWDAGFPVSDAGDGGVPFVDQPENGFPPPTVSNKPSAVLTPAQRKLFAGPPPVFGNDDNDLKMPLSLTLLEYLSSLEYRMKDLIAKAEAEFNPGAVAYVTSENGRLMHPATKAYNDATQAIHEMQSILAHIEGIQATIARGDLNAESLAGDLSRLQQDFRRQAGIYDWTLETFLDIFLQKGFFAAKTVERAQNIIIQGLRTGTIKPDYRLAVAYIEFNVAGANKIGSTFTDVLLEAFRDVAAETFGMENVSRGTRTNVRVVLPNIEPALIKKYLQQKVSAMERKMIERAKGRCSKFSLFRFKRKFFLSSGFSLMPSPAELRIDPKDIREERPEETRVAIAKEIGEAFQETAVVAATKAKKNFKEVAASKGRGGRVFDGELNRERVLTPDDLGSYQGKLLAGQRPFRLERVANELRNQRTNLEVMVQSLSQRVDQFKIFLQSNSKSLPQLYQYAVQDPRYGMLINDEMAPQKLDALVRGDTHVSPEKLFFMTRKGDEIGFFIRGLQNGETKTFCIFLELKDFGAFNDLYFGGAQDSYLNRFLENALSFLKKEGWTSGEKEITPEILSGLGEEIQKITQRAFPYRFNRKVKTGVGGARVARWEIWQGNKKTFRNQDLVPIKTGWVGERIAARKDKSGKTLKTRIRWQLYEKGKPVGEPVISHDTKPPQSKTKEYCIREQGKVGVGVVFLEVIKDVKSGRIFTSIWNLVNEKVGESKKSGKPVTVELVPQQNTFLRYGKNITGGLLLYTLQEGVVAGADFLLDGKVSFDVGDVGNFFTGFGLQTGGSIGGSILAGAGFNLSNKLPLMDMKIFQEPPTSGWKGLAWDGIPMVVTVAASDLYYNHRFTAATPVGLINLSASSAVISLALRSLGRVPLLERVLAPGTPYTKVTHLVGSTLLMVGLSHLERKIFENDLEKRYLHFKTEIEKWQQHSPPREQYEKLLQDFAEVSEEKASYTELYSDSPVGAVRKEYLEAIRDIEEETEEGESLNQEEEYGSVAIQKTQEVELARKEKIREANQGYREKLEKISKESAPLTDLERQRIDYEMRKLDIYAAYEKEGDALLTKAETNGLGEVTDEALLTRLWQLQKQEEGVLNLAGQAFETLYFSGAAKPSATDHPFALARQIRREAHTMLKKLN